MLSAGRYLCCSGAADALVCTRLPLQACLADVAHRCYPSFCGCPTACYVPCDPGYPDDRLAMYLEDAQAAVLLTEPAQQRRAESLAPFGCHVVCVADACAQASGGSPPATACGAKDPAYIIFTSGSTGRPKGVVVRHEGVRDYACFLRERFQLGPQDCSVLSIPSECCAVAGTRRGWGPCTAGRHPGSGQPAAWLWLPATLCLPAEHL